MSWTLRPSPPVPAAGTPSRLPGAREPGGFYGWHVVVLAAVALAMTGPGQTAGVSVFIDPLVHDLGVSRETISTAYLVGTLSGTLVVPYAGRLLDRWGVRRTMLLIGALFGAVLIASATVAGVVGVTLAFVGIRSLGQGALGLSATTAAARWFERRRGTAMGVVSAAGSCGIALTPLLADLLIAAQGWRVAWVVLGLLVWAVVLPLARWGLRDDPRDLGQVPDGRPVPGQRPVEPWGMTRSEAARQPWFWVIVAGVAVSGMLFTAVAFHQVSLLGERGLSSTEAAANFLPQSVAGVVATLVTGRMIDKLNPRWVVVSSMLVHVLALGWATVATPGWSAVGFGVAIGSGGAMIRATEAAAVPHYFGVLHIGALRGVVAAVSVGSTAFGPLLFAAAHGMTGSYAEILWISTLLPLAVATAAVVVRPPRARFGSAEQHVAH